MPAESCPICKTVALPRSGINCTLCKKLYHTKCVNVTNVPDFDQFPGLEWRCKMCMSSRSNNDAALATILSKLNELGTDMAVIKNQQNDMKDSLEFYGAKIDEFNKKMTEFDNKIKIISQVENKVVKINNEVVQLQQEVNQLNQQLRMTNIEITGVPERANENVFSIVTEIFTTLGVATPGNIDSSHRIPHANKENKFPKSIIVKCTSKNVKDSVINAIKSRKGLKAADIGINCNNNNSIYINDHLTPSNKSVYKKVREFCKIKNYQYWTKDCKIFIRNSATGKVTHIRNEEQLRLMS